MSNQALRLRDAFAREPVRCLPQTMETLGCSRRAAIPRLTDLSHLTS